jgi:hypothetical protein
MSIIRQPEDKVMRVYILSQYLSRKLNAGTWRFCARTCAICRIYKLNIRHYSQVIHDNEVGVSPTHAEQTKENQMDTGKIFLGIALIAFSVAMVVNPANAAGCDSSCPVGSGNYYTDDCWSKDPVQAPEYTAHSAAPAVLPEQSGKICHTVSPPGSP